MSRNHEIVYTPYFQYKEKGLMDFDFKNCKNPISYLSLDYPSLKEYGGNIDCYDDIKKLLNNYQAMFDISALELDAIDIYEVFPEKAIDFLKNTVKLYAKVFDLLKPSESRLEFRRMNKHCIGESENLWNRIIEKYHWNEE